MMPPNASVAGVKIPKWPISVGPYQNKVLKTADMDGRRAKAGFRLKNVVPVPGIIVFNSTTILMATQFHAQFRALLQL